MKMDCRLDVAYPPVAVERKNMGYARLLSSDFAGMVSEMTAVTQYFYQHLVLSCSCPELAETLSCISKVEMHHLEMIGELITAFGGTPVYNCRGRWWSGAYPSTAVDKDRILRENIAAEKSAIANYRMRIQQIDDAGARKVLERIILDEENHIKLFECYLEK